MDYNDIDEIEKHKLLNEIILSAGFFSERNEDIFNYYYICNTPPCYDNIVYYYEREEHREKHKISCCIIL